MVAEEISDSWDNSDATADFTVGSSSGRFLIFGLLLSRLEAHVLEDEVVEPHKLLLETGGTFINKRNIIIQLVC